MNNHKLIINSLRDIQCECTCGRWEYIVITNDKQTDKELRREFVDRFSQ